MGNGEADEREQMRDEGLGIRGSAGQPMMVHSMRADATARRHAMYQSERMQMHGLDGGSYESDEFVAQLKIAYSSWCCYRRWTSVSRRLLVRAWQTSGNVLSTVLALRLATDLSDRLMSIASPDVWHTERRDGGDRRWTLAAGIDLIGSAT